MSYILPRRFPGVRDDGKAAAHHAVDRPHGLPHGRARKGRSVSAIEERQRLELLGVIVLVNIFAM